MAEVTYGRGQVEWALWCSFARPRSDTGDMPKVFRTRIKRLLEIDRNLDLSDAEVQPEAAYAFAPPPSAESGEAPYSAVDTFCLAIALDLLDAGFKQAEIVLLMRYLRPKFQERFPGLLPAPSLPSRQRYRAKDYPDLPSYQVDGDDRADSRLFVILQKIELTEINSAVSRQRLPGPIILEPVFCNGVTELAEKIHNIMPHQRRAVTILEVAAIAQSVQAYLSEAPNIRRGRPKA